MHPVSAWRLTPRRQLMGKRKEAAALVRYYLARGIAGGDGGLPNETGAYNVIAALVALALGHGGGGGAFEIWQKK